MTTSQSEARTEATTLPCAVCRKTLDRMDANYDIPYAANIFVSHGHYGATAYDSPGGEHLELLICTDCLDAMKANAVVDRVLHATEATPVASNAWGSSDDPKEDNPWNRQRLRNEFAMNDFLDAHRDVMHGAWASRIFESCMEASRRGMIFDPAAVSAAKVATDA